jgi:HD-like signal output (HDOD) protein
LPKEFLSIIDTVSQKKADLDQAEMEMVGATHSQIGAWLAEKWNLPRIIVDAIAFHHSPWKAREDPVLVAIVCVANYLCHLSHIGNSGRIDPQKPDDQTWDIFRTASLPLDESDIVGLRSEFLMEFDKTDLMLTSMKDEH